MYMCKFRMTRVIDTKAKCDFCPARVIVTGTSSDLKQCVFIRLTVANELFD